MTNQATVHKQPDTVSQVHWRSELLLQQAGETAGSQVRSVFAILLLFFG